MNMQMCPNGHFFDMSKAAQCPYCAAASAEPEPAAAPAESVMPAPEPEIVREPAPADAIGRTVPVFHPVDEGRTVAVMHKHIGVDPVVGWLVCTDGRDRGRDYRIRGGNNSVGRSEEMDVCITGDDAISKVDMAYITYDAEAKKFYAVAGKGKNVVRVDGELLPVGQARELKAYSRLRLGETTLMLAPLCGDSFDWA